ncbi:MAG: putative Type II site-specific deoxyribonuclease [Nitrosopumilales archaeon]|nr:MAG: putative Type II site-specific deoxyribonuclease [Nitrosopumilales archaeon]
MDENRIKGEIRVLVKKYQRIAESGEISNYNEEMTKKDFILPLFKILGWDTENKIEDEVTAEENISRKRIDYAFRIHKIPKIVLEAKGINHKLDDRRYIDQTINYAWLKGVTWAVLTNFKKIKVFNSEIKATTPIALQVFEIDCENFENSEELLLLSKDSIIENKLNEKAELLSKNLPKKPVDERLYDDLIQARESLSKTILKFNKNVNSEELEEIIQRILSRLIFIRTLEDRGFCEPILLPIIRDEQTKVGITPRLNVQFRHLDDIYDARLFAPHFCEELDIGNYTWRTIIQSFYETEDQLQQYNFEILDADILGGIYEQYLGLISKNGSINDKTKKTFRKKEGIYYTPKYIVEYILDSIFNELNKENLDIKKIKILDLSCGSGSFLIKAFDYLASNMKSETSAHLDSNNINEISYDTKTRIIQNNIFGVDLDSQAIEITHLNMFLKGLEKDQHLPVIKNNIVCGNSLVSDKTIDERSLNWAEDFSGTSNGGFDVIVGNPPYIRNRELNNNLKEFLNENYETAEGQYDIYQLFFEKGISLLKNGGLLGFITSNKYAITNYGKKLRKKILDTCKILSIIDVSNIRVFKDASTYPYIIILKKEKDEEKRNNNMITISKVLNEDEIFKKPSQKIIQSEFLKNKDYIFNINVDKTQSKLLEKIQLNTMPLGNFTIKETVHTGNIRDKLIVEKKINNNCKKLLRGKNCQRYFYTWENLWLNSAYKINRTKGEYATIPDDKYFQGPKIFLREIAEKITACYDEDNFYSLNKAYVVSIPDKNISTKFVLALLNSNLISWFFRTKFESAHVRGGYLQFKKQYTSLIPIKKISLNEQQPFIQLVDEIHDCYAKLNQLQGKKTNQSERIEKEIKKIDKKIDGLVYDLYNISEEDRKIIENDHS